MGNIKKRMTEKYRDSVSLLDLHYFLNHRLAVFNDEQMDLWRIEQKQIAQDEWGGVDLLIEKRAQTGSTRYLDSAISLRGLAETHEAMSRLPNPYQANNTVLLNSSHSITFWLQ